MTDIPFDRRIWTAKQVSEYLEQHYDTFMKKTRYLPGFPDPLEAFRTGQPRWAARDVSAWALGESRTNHARQELRA